MLGFLKKNGWLILLAAVGAALLLLSGVKADGGANTSRSDAENEIREICSAFPGVTARSVKVSLSDQVAVSSGASPRVEGIAIILHGSNAKVRLQLTELLSAAYSLPANKICLVESS